ncbi:unnamed protein product [Ceratitis capitata]|uniref:(Mediterranean fruit fly) hypothetical protein n=1 Tax=Ceratitis capitata TaxID=7213 RepID=A0A811V0N4_CERCA|nr:unnamed protein product [Ceratitis capitata]
MTYIWHAKSCKEQLPPAINNQLTKQRQLGKLHDSYGAEKGGKGEKVLIHATNLRRNYPIKRATQDLDFSRTRLVSLKQKESIIMKMAPSFKVAPDRAPVPLQIHSLEIRNSLWEAIFVIPRGYIAENLLDFKEKRTAFPKATDRLLVPEN